MNTNTYTTPIALIYKRELARIEKELKLLKNIKNSYVRKNKQKILKEKKRKILNIIGK